MRSPQFPLTPAHRLDRLRVVGQVLVEVNQASRQRNAS